MHAQNRWPRARRLQTWLSGAALLLAASTVSAQPVTPPPMDPTGAWLVEKQLAIIRIVDCGGQYWGVVAWEKYPSVDKNNPDVTKRSRPTLGMPILLGMTQTKANQWSGDIYNSEDGRTYSASITLTAPDVLRVQGCVLGFLCGGESWTRVQPLTDTNSTAAPSKTPNKSVSKVPAKPAAKSAAKAPPPNHAGTATSQAAVEPPLIREQSDEQICLGLVGPPGSPHEGGLK
jgi:uncharacterized protein (DUF2147 family)